MSLITLLNPLHRSAMMNSYLLSTSVCESIPVRRGCVIAYTIVYLPERDIFTIYTGDAHSPAARKTRRTQNPPHAKPVARTQPYFSLLIFTSMSDNRMTWPRHIAYMYIYSVGQKNWPHMFFASFISKINSYEANIISVDSIFQ